MTGKIPTPNHFQQPKPILHHSMRRIIVSYNNRKKHGAFPVTHKTCEGCISSKGQVVLFSDDLAQKGYSSVQEMKDTLGEYGDVEIDYINNTAESTMPSLSLFTKVVLRDLILNGFLRNEIHDLIWFYASKYKDAEVEQELKNLQTWLESEQS